MFVRATLPRNSPVSALHFFVVLLLIAVTATAAYCEIKPGFYTGAAAHQIRELEEQADRTLTCYGIDQITEFWVPGHSKAVKPLQTGCKPLTREELKVVLQSELHHDFLAINFSKLMNKDPQDAFTELEPFIDDLGYKRILVTGSNCCGIPVVKDYAPPAPEQK